MQTKDTFTPGPWRVDRNGLSGYGDNGNTFNIRAGGDGRRDGELIASLPSSFRLLDRDDPNSDEVREEEANARLIAAAPALLEACAKLAAWDQSDSDTTLLSEACSQARAAIAAATGE